ncbi:MAG TPA: RHS repeat-associated core domain-containing protein [Candidatus Angelobacter sp.]
MTSATVMNARGLGGGVVAAQNVGNSVALLGSKSFTYPVPLFSLPGRAAALDLTLYYNSLVWIYNGSNNSMVLAADFNTPSPGFTLHYGLVQFSPDLSFGVFYDSTGARRLFFQTATPNLYQTQDSTYIQIQYPSTSGGSATVTYPSGLKLICQPFTVLANNTTEYRTSQIEDTNGNFVSITYINNNDLRINTITDSVGRVIKFNYDSNGLLSTVAQLHADGSVFRQYTFTLSPLTVTFNFTLKATAGLGLTPGYLTSGQTVVNVLTKVTRPDGTSISFDYVHDGTTNGNPDWVTVKTIQELSASNPPAVRYFTSYIFPTIGAGTLAANPTYTQQTVNDGQNSATWTFQSTTSSSGLVTASTINDPGGNTTTTTFSANGDSLDGLPIQQQVMLTQICIPGPCTTPPLRTVNFTWALDSNGANPRVTSTTTTLEDGVTQSQATCAKYDAFGHCTDAFQYDFGNNQPGALSSETLTSYASLGNIVNRVSDVQIKNAAGTVLSHRKLNYDEGTVKDPVTYPVGHDSAFASSYSGSRGNLTSTVEYADAAHTSGGITTTSTYDSTGNLLTSKRGSSNQTQFNFSSATQYAYPDSISVGPLGNQLTTSFVYDMDRGLPASVTDTNGLKTTFTRDLDNRPLTTTTPDSVVVTAGYDDASARPSATNSNSVNSLVTRTTLDGRGRTLSHQVLNGSSLVSTTAFSYNIMGQLLQASNPYGPNDTVQKTTYTYDHLGRILSTTPPAVDGSGQNPYQAQYVITQFTDAAGNQHFGPMATSTDPAGKQRRQYGDALGHLLRIDEPGSSGGAAGSGSVTISGTEQSASTSNGNGATAATGSVTFSGTERSTVVRTHYATTASITVTIGGSDSTNIFTTCPTRCFTHNSPDAGTIQFTVNAGGTTVGPVSVNYNDTSTTASIAAALYSAFPSNSVVTMSNPNGSPTFTLTTTAMSSSANSSTFSDSRVSSCDTTSDYWYCAGVGWTMTLSGPNLAPTTVSSANLTGGSDNVDTTFYDTGAVTVSLTINGTAYSKQSTYGQTTTPSGIAGDLASQINSDTTLNKLLVATSSSNVLNLTTTATGANTADPLSASAATNSQYFSSSSSSFIATPSGSTLKPGQNGTVYDAGSVTLSLTGFTNKPIQYIANYSQGSTPATIASALKGAINNDTFAPVVAGISGNSPSVVSLIAKSLGADTNYGLTITSATSQSTYFSQSSFTGNAGSLTGGTDPAASLSTPLSTYYSYDPLGNLQQITQGQQTRSYQYDSLRRLVSSAVPETASQPFIFTYNDSGTVAQKTDPRTLPGTSTHITATYAYDSLNRVQTITYNDGTPVVTYTYNAPQAANNTGGRLATVTVGDSTQPSQYASDSYQYDIMGRVTKCTKVIGTSTYVISYSYNADGTIASITYPSGRTVNNSYDAIGRLSQVGTGGTNILNIGSYTPAGEIANVTYGNGITGNYSFNNQLQLASAVYGNSSSSLLNLAYNYGGAQDNGQILGITDKLAPAQSTSYFYDELDRLRVAQTNDLTSANTWKLKFTYDRYGNRLSEVPIAGTANMPMNEGFVDATTNRLSASGYFYDAAGNMIGDGLNNYAFDAKNELKSTSPDPGMPGTPATFVYDPNGLRVNNNGTTYIYDSATAIAEYPNGSSANSPGVEYVYAGSYLVASIAGTTVTYYYGDHLSTRVQADGTGKVVRTFGQYPFGETWYETGTPSKWKFTSYERDSSSSGLDYALARFDSSRLGRFVSLDPLSGGISNPQSLNRYSYAMNDPVNFTDPSGAELRGNLLCLLDNQGNCVGGNGGGNCPTIDGMLDVGCMGGSSFPGLDVFAVCPTNLCIYNADGYRALNNLIDYAYWVNHAFTGNIFGVIAIGCSGSWSNPTGHCEQTGSTSFQTGLIPPWLIGEWEPPHSCFGGDAWCDQEGNVISGRGILDSSGIIFGGVGLARGLLGSLAAAGETETVEEGTQLFRVFGDEAQPFGHSWTTVNPGEVANYRVAAGLFDGNTGRFVVEGILNDAEGVTLRGSLPGPGGLGGGLPEIIVPDPATQITIIRVSGVNPPY